MKQPSLTARLEMLEKLAIKAEKAVTLEELRSIVAALIRHEIAERREDADLLA